MSEDGVQVECSITVEQLDSAGQTSRRQVLRKASILLGRNEFQDLILRLHDGKVSQSFAAQDFKLFTKFVREGKCTIRLLPSNTQILLSNCPPAQLGAFLKTLTIKHQASRCDRALSQRERLKAGLPRSFEAISPLQHKDIQKVNEQRAQASAAGKLADRTNTAAGRGAQVKRSRDNCGFSPVKANPTKKPVLALPSCKLNKEQAAVLSAVLSGKNVFFTGSAGTGKSFLLKRIIGSLPPKSTFSTASTGVAACHIGGTTLHSFAGIGSGSAPLDQCISLAQRPGVLQHWTSCRHLIIDEVSMVEAHYFDKLESVARSVRRSTEPFGGIQLIVCGDFLQLPPVSKGKDKAQFCFQSRSWRKVMQVNMELSEVRRQTDQSFISLLQAVRVGRARLDLGPREQTGPGAAGTDWTRGRGNGLDPGTRERTGRGNGLDPGPRERTGPGNAGTDWPRERTGPGNAGTDWTRGCGNRLDLGPRERTGPGAAGTDWTRGRGNGLDPGPRERTGPGAAGTDWTRERGNGLDPGTRERTGPGAAGPDWLLALTPLLSPLRVTEDVTSRLMHSAHHSIERDGILATRLCTHKDDVELTNQNKLQQLPGNHGNHTTHLTAPGSHDLRGVREFEALDSDPSLEKTINAHSPVSRLLQLKVGAQVMLTKNLDVARGLVNGARGVVVSFQTEKHGFDEASEFI
uniref:ATP-dependent DNA helicase n=1 Tax=Knipowitschia caucasica TaxID=637954 RepID=A0AAV2JVE3_KNICA